MRRHVPATRHAFVTDVTSGYAQINVQGPRSRELMQSVTTADLSNEAFPFRAAREIDIGFARALCVRITYLGELGYELYIPTEQATHVYDRLVEAGETFGLRHAGLKALASCRMEKGYRDYGHDIDNTDSVLEAGLGFAVDLEEARRIPRQGGGARARRPRARSQRRLVQVLREGSGADDVPRRGRASRRQGRRLRPRRRRTGHTLGGAVGLAMIEAGETDRSGVPRRGALGDRDRRKMVSGGHQPREPLYKSKKRGRHQDVMEKEESRAIARRLSSSLHSSRGLATGEEGGSPRRAQGSSVPSFARSSSLTLRSTMRSISASRPPRATCATLVRTGACAVVAPAGRPGRRFATPAVGCPRPDRVDVRGAHRETRRLRPGDDIFRRHVRREVAYECRLVDFFALMRVRATYTTHPRGVKGFALLFGVSVADEG